MREVSNEQYVKLLENCFEVYRSTAIEEQVRLERENEYLSNTLYRLKRNNTPNKIIAVKNVEPPSLHK